LAFCHCKKLDAVEFQSVDLRIDRKAFEGVLPAALVATPAGGKVTFCQKDDTSFKATLDQTGHTGFEISECPAARGTSVSQLLLDPADRMRDTKHAVRGGFGVVYKLRHKKTGQVTAAKEVNSTEDLFLRELGILCELRHPNVLGLVGYYPAIEPQPFTLVTEWMSRGSLDTVLFDRNVSMDSTQMVKIVTGIILGMRYVHACGVMHRDLKPGNILLTKGMSAKIGDLGSARLEAPGGGSLTTDLGTSAYMAPEIAEGEYGRPVDVFAFGIMLWEIVTRRRAYAEFTGRGPMFLHTQIVKGSRPKPIDDVPQSAKELMELCWAHEPGVRPTFAMIFENLQQANYQLLPDVDADEIRAYVAPILAEEAEYQPTLIEAPDIA
jgi:serine/threonine protein kinase